jgi:hypothetical protein
MERRGHAFVRYADDLKVYVGSTRAGERVMALLAPALHGAPPGHQRGEERGGVGLHPPVSRLCLLASPGLGEAALAPKALKVMKDRVRVPTRRAQGQGAAHCTGHACPRAVDRGGQARAQHHHPQGVHGDIEPALERGWFDVGTNRALLNSYAAVHDAHLKRYPTGHFDLDRAEYDTSFTVTLQAGAHTPPVPGASSGLGIVRAVLGAAALIGAAVAYLFLRGPLATRGALVLSPRSLLPPRCASKPRES